ncbi:MAG: AAA family ATPase, partial [Clostridia bacterium]|nr:AAA family ATPase [Clostridia bacterium]
NVRVQNYHGFAYGELARNGVRCGLSEVLQVYNKHRFPIRGIDVLILDEYQDIELEIADLLEHIKSCNPGMQIIAVGDMAQKIYDKTTLDVPNFMSEFLGSCYKLEFTQCFRLCAPLAAVLGQVWGKEIVGVNDDCSISYMTLKEVLAYVSKCDPKDVLCLGSTSGMRNWLLNQLEEKYPEKFNKRTIWSKITDNDSGGTQPDSNAGIFTTYDGCKGMERDVCVVFDWTIDYWNVRLGKPFTRYEILRNIFCVAASRGKKKIIFCKRGNAAMLDTKTLMTDPGANRNINDMEMSKMFDFKFAEDVERAYKCVSVSEIRPDGDEIPVVRNDGLIDLSPCVGIYQEAAFFKHSDIDTYINMYFATHPDDEGKRVHGWESWPLDGKVLYYTSLDTGQNRYLYQVTTEFITDESWDMIKARLSERLSPDDMAQVRTDMKFYDKGRVAFGALGYCDVLKDDVVYELKFVSELSHVHVLQLAMYLVSMKKEVGLLWNVRTNRILEVRVPNRSMFLDAVVRAVTKGAITKYSDGSDIITAKRPTNQKAFDFQTKAIEFVREHSRVCYDLMLDYMSDFLLDVKWSGSRVERYFHGHDIGMNMTGKTFLKYFGDAMLSNMDSFSESERVAIRSFLETCYPGA